MTAKSAIDDFIAQRKLAVVGVSRKGRKFGNLAFKELKAKGYQLFPVHPAAETLEGERCYPNLKSLPWPVDGVLLTVPPAETEKLVQEAVAAGIRRIWIQQGAESPAAIRFCLENRIPVIHGECILMFTEPTAWYHRAHRWVWKLLGKMPT